MIVCKAVTFMEYVGVLGVMAQQTAKGHGMTWYKRWSASVIR